MAVRSKAKDEFRPLLRKYEEALMGIRVEAVIPSQGAGTVDDQRQRLHVITERLASSWPGLLPGRSRVLELSRRCLDLFANGENDAAASVARDIDYCVSIAYEYLAKETSRTERYIETIRDILLREWRGFQAASNPQWDFIRYDGIAFEVTAAVTRSPSVAACADWLGTYEAKVLPDSLSTRSELLSLAQRLKAVPA